MIIFNDYTFIKPYSFSPELVYKANSDKSVIYLFDSCYSLNSEYSYAQITGQSYLLRQSRQQLLSFMLYMSSSYKSLLYLISTLSVWCKTETSLNENSGINLSSESLKLKSDTA